MDTDLYVRLKEHMVDYEILKEPHEILIAEEYGIEGIVKDTIGGILYDERGDKQLVFLSVILWPYLGSGDTSSLRMSHRKRES